MTQLALNLHEGRKRRNTGIAQVTSKNGTFVETLKSVARMIARNKGTVTADDLRIWADRNGMEPTSPNAYGAIFAKNPDFEPCGFCPSAQPNRRGGMIRVWRLRNSVPATLQALSQ